MAPRRSYPAVVPVALPGPTELYLSQVNKSFWHYKIFKGEERGGKEEGGRVGGGSGKARLKNFLNFYGMTACFTYASPSAALCSGFCVCVCARTRMAKGWEDLPCHSNSLELHLYHCH